MKSVKAVWTAGLTLSRLPNLLTVPGDPLAGYLLVAGPLAFADWRAALPLMGSALALYLAGVWGNDYCDRALDAVERPERPLPAGVIRPGWALAVALIFTVLGVGWAGWRCGVFSGGVAAALAGLIWLYNGVTKRSAVWGPLNMGACRGASLLLGGSLAGFAEWRAHLDLPAAAIGYTLLVAAITRLARDENRLAHAGPRRWGPGLLTALWLGGLAWRLGRWENFGIASGWILAVAASVWMLSVGWALPATGARPDQTRQAIGQWISGFLLGQAALCALSGYPSRGPAMVLLAAFPLYGWIGRRFRGS